MDTIQVPNANQYTLGCSMSDARFQAHASIGLAVMACQALEMLFAMCVRLAFKHQDAASLSDVTPLEKNFSKPPMKNLLSELRKYVEVSEEFEDKLVDLIERRHTLIHRWGIENGFPADDDAFQKVTEFSNILAKDANGLANVLYAYMEEWVSRFPEFRAQFSEGHLILSTAIPEELKGLKIERPK